MPFQESVFGTKENALPQFIAQVNRILFVLGLYLLLMRTRFKKFYNRVAKRNNFTGNFQVKVKMVEKCMKYSM